ncbi:conserved exported hypothetical protein [Rubrivivax sp. A210]|uniref:DUF3016 domain-containing protein n=1 Tax=Rubrivivax sp. A210 TaxID=2772301 RepID=UPI00191871D8|nr:DUF3016 domain-containing protein [Rubrivivax sp. A210]CAD5372067.1 conserved exported hypothetical protein [Rubrivivax sp. A210]
MHTAFPCLLFATTLAAAGNTLAAGEVQVNWIGVEQYSDIGRATYERNHTMNRLTAHLQGLGRHLPNGQILTIDVLDLDLAGTLRQRPTGELRVLRGGADWPRISLRYTLQATGRTVAAGEEHLSDLDYLAHVRQGDLAYEKQMLERWFVKTFDTP